MERFTRTPEEGGGACVVDDAKVVRVAEGYSGDAIDRLAAFEDLHAEVMASQARLTEEIEKLRAEGRTKTTRFREALGRKLTNTALITLFKNHGLE